MDRFDMIALQNFGWASSHNEKFTKRLETRCLELFPATFGALRCPRVRLNCIESSNYSQKAVPAANIKDEPSFADLRRQICPFLLHYWDTHAPKRVLTPRTTFDDNPSLILKYIIYYRSFSRRLLSHSCESWSNTSVSAGNIYISIHYTVVV